jgi:DNA-binding transcriptional LysR family regulator
LNAQEVDIAIVSEPNITKNVRQEALGSNEFGWLASADLALPRRSLRPADLEQRHLIIPPPPARLHDTVNRWFAHAGVKPKRVSTCNSVPATILTVMYGVAIALLPLRVVEEELSRGTLKVVRVSPPVPSHRVSICYQVSEFGEGVRVLVDLIRELVTRYHLFI